MTASRQRLVHLNKVFLYASLIEVPIVLPHDFIRT
jgi:hypothetical protein